MFHLKLVFLHVFLVTGSHQIEIVFFDLEKYRESFFMQRPVHMWNYFFLKVHLKKIYIYLEGVLFIISEITR